MRIHHLAVACALACTALAAGAQSLKPGLWEIHNKTNNPQVDQAMAEMQKQLASMPPEQRKQMEAMMAKQGVKMAGSAGGGMVVQTCMTKEMVERDNVPMQDGCKVTKQDRSGNTMKMAYVCTNPPSSGEGEFTFASPESYRSRMTVRTSAQGKADSMTMETTGKWLKADCGSVKPPAVPKK